MPFQTPPPTFFTIDGIYSHRYDQSVIATFDAISTIKYYYDTNECESTEAASLFLNDTCCIDVVELESSVPFN